MTAQAPAAQRNTVTRACRAPRLARAPIGLAALLCAGAAAYHPVPAAAQGQACGPRDVVISRLAETYGETRHSIGLGSNNAVMELFASDETGTWTITVTSTNGVTCLVASGLAFETLAESLPPEESDA